jgi:hypothetical protein
VPLLIADKNMKLIKVGEYIINLDQVIYMQLSNGKYNGMEVRLFFNGAEGEVTGGYKDVDLHTRIAPQSLTLKKDTAQAFLTYLVNSGLVDYIA